MAVVFSSKLYHVSCMFCNTFSNKRWWKHIQFNLKQLNIKLEMFYYFVVCVSVWKWNVQWVALKAGTHQANLKELATTKANSVVTSRRLCLDQKAVLNAAQTTADCKLVCAFCASVPESAGINILYSSFKLRNRNIDIQNVLNTSW